MVDGDDGFEAWYRAVHPRLVTALVAVTGDADVGREATDEALARALERWHRVHAMGSPEAWTYRVGLNVARRRFRRRHRERELASAAGESSRNELPGPVAELWDVVAALPRRQREAVVLRHVADLTEAQVAEAMGVARGTVSTNLRRAYETLRHALDDDSAADRITAGDGLRRAPGVRGGSDRGGHDG